VKIKTKIFLTFILLLFPVVAFAQGIVPCGNSSQSPCTLCHLIVGIFNLITWGRNILLIITIVGIFFAGILYMISSGSKLAEQAKKLLTSSIVGFVLVLTAWLVVATIMWLISAKPDLGINKTGANWQTGSISFDCNSQSQIGN
jgi:hypothetical protein